MEVPSAIIPQEMNYLINPIHPDIKKIRIVNTVDYIFDDRILDRYNSTT